MNKGIVIDSGNVEPFVCDHTYSSKLLMDHTIAGEAAINVNEGTLSPGECTGGGVHQKGEIYYAIQGEAVLHLDEVCYDFGPGCVAYIPGGVHHWLENKSTENSFVLLTFWPDAADNEVYHTRIKAWGTSIRYINSGTKTD